MAACAAFRLIRYSWTNRACLGVNFIGAIRYLRPMAQHPPDQPDPHACQAMMLVLPYLNQILIWQYFGNVNSQMVNSAETGLFAIAAAMSGFVRFGTAAAAAGATSIYASRYLEPYLEAVFHTDSYGYRPGRSAIAMPCAKPVSAAGGMTGCSIST